MYAHKSCFSLTAVGVNVSVLLGDSRLVPVFSLLHHGGVRRFKGGLHPHQPLGIFSHSLDRFICSLPLRASYRPAPVLSVAQLREPSLRRLDPLHLGDIREALIVPLRRLECVERLVRVVFELCVERDRVRLAVVAARRPARHIGKFHLGFRDLWVRLKKGVVLHDVPQRRVPFVNAARQLLFRAAVLLVQPQQLGVLRLGEFSREHPVHQLRIARVVRIVGAVLRLAAPAECRAGIVDLKPPLPVHAAIPARFLPDGLVVRPALFHRFRAA